MQNVAIITARGGSKRIPRKNIKDFHGKPIIAYSIEAALKSGVFTEVMVSTDDSQIAEIARDLGANVPFIRSDKNSDDFSTTTDVLLEVLSEYKERGIEFDNLCCIYPTAPFVSSALLEKTYKKLISSNNAEGLLPVVKFGFPIQRSLQINKEDYCSSVWPEFSLKRSQDLDPRYHDVGQFYWLKAEPFLKQKKLYVDNLLAHEIDELESQDIDTEQDWKIAELKYQMLHLIED